MELNGKRMVITGATSGLGLEVLKMLLLKYDDVRILAVGRKMESLPQDPRVFPFQCDVSSREGVDEIFNAAAEKLGGIDVFWANAGFGYYEKFGAADWDKMQSIFHTNVLSPFYSLEKMLTLYPGQKFNFMVTDSIAGQLEVPGFALYGSTKHALNGGMSSIQYEVPENVKISIIYPIATRTQFFERAGTTIGNNGMVQSSEDCARAILEGLRKEKKKIYPYKLWPTLNFLMTVLPCLKHTVLKKLTKSVPGIWDK